MTALSDQSSVSVVILNYNGREYLEVCLDSLLRTNFPADKLEVILLDNGSSDDSVALVEERFPSVSLIKSETNLGFSRGANLAAEKAKGSYLAFVNNDMHFDENWLVGLLDALDSEAGVVCGGSLVMNWDGTAVDFAGRPDDAFALSYQKREYGILPYRMKSLFVSGGALLIEKSLFLELGGFDPHYFMYHEDVDLCWRLWLRGYKCVLSPKSIVYHKGGASAAKLDQTYIQRLGQAHALYTVFKNLEGEGLRRLLPRVMDHLLARSRRLPALDRAVPLAFHDFLGSLELLVARRRESQQARVRTDDEIFSEVGHPLGFLLHENGGLLPREVETICAAIDFDSADAASLGARLAECLNAIHSAFILRLLDEVREKERQAEELTSEVAVQGARLEELETDLKHRNIEIERLDSEVRHLSDQLQRIVSSAGWKVLNRYGRLKYRYLLPVYRLFGLLPPQQRAEAAPGEDRPRLRVADRVRSAAFYDELVIQPQFDKEYSERIASEPPATSPLHCADVVCFSIIDWDFRFQRPQQIMARFAAAGHRVFYISTNRFRSADSSPRVSITNLRENVYEVSLSVLRPPMVYGEVIDGGNKVVLLEALEELRRSFGLDEVIGYVMIPSWGRVALEARDKWGWHIIYDCMDEWENFPGIQPVLLEMESKLVEQCDLLVVTAQRLVEKWSSIRTDMVLARNATDYEFYAAHLRSNGLLRDARHPVIGYYGAIADWFDVELVAYAASKRPNYTFVLLGGIFDIDVSSLKALSNVRLLGQQPYEKMPEYLFNFDVCMIPFKLNPITEATDPVKVYEYLSGGKPVVSVALPELDSMREHVYIGKNRDDFVLKLDLAVSENGQNSVARRKEFASRNTWRHRVDSIKDGIAKTAPRASIIVVTYNNLPLTKLCLDSIVLNTEYLNYEIVVVDNNSIDGSQPYLERLSGQVPNLKVILNRSNEGFASANNQGIAQSSGQFLVLLNNDTVVPPGWLSRLLRHLEDPGIGLVGPMTNFVGNEAIIDVPYAAWAEMEAFAVEHTWANDGLIADIHMLAMFCVAMRREAYDKVGPLDQQFGIGMFEDDDYSMRVKAKGLRVVCAADVFVHHFGQAAFKELIKSGDYDPLFEQNRKLYEAKWKMTWVPHRRASLKLARHSIRRARKPEDPQLGE